MANYRLNFLAVFALAICAWMLGGHLLHRHISSQNKTFQLEASADQLMRRVEKAIDYVVIAGTELLVEGKTECNFATEEFLRRLVLQTATVADIYLVTPNSVCSSFGMLSANLPTQEERSDWTRARNPSYRIGSIDAGNHSTIGVSWGLNTDLELVSAVSVEAALFDILSSELRPYGHINLIVNEQVLSSFSGEAVEADTAAGWSPISVDGERYPLNIEIRVEPMALQAWRREISPLLQIGWATFGVLAALATSTALTRGHNTELTEVVRALTNQEILPHFQLILDTYSGDVVGCEALARWIRPDGTSMSPDRFIPLVEKFALDDELLSVMVEQTARDLREIFFERPDFYVSFNVTPDRLCKPDFAETLIALARQNFLPPKQICIEITERQVIASPDAAAQTIESLRVAGFRVALDDAGTGHNGLASLQKLKVDSIKIDKFFVDHIAEDPRSRVMVDMFVSVATKYGMTTVAEGVENVEQIHALRLAGVDFLQGYLLKRPLEAEKFKQALAETSQHYSEITFAISEGMRNVNDAAEYRNKSNVHTLPSTDDSGAVYNEDEASRLAALYRCQLLDTPEEEAFDRIPRIAKNALHVPFAAIALIDENRRWFKSVAGGQRGELPRSQSFCNHTVQSSDPTIVQDTHSDDRFRDNPLVTNAPHVRAYLGVPLQTNDGYRIGSLCCIDTAPRTFTKQEVQMVRDLSSIVMDQIELRKLRLFDDLTAICSRRGFLSEMERRLADAQTQKHPLSILMLDIDHFKQINDGYGRKIGDEVLAKIGERIVSAVGEYDIVGRVGGEEFAIALFGATLSEAKEVAEDIRYQMTRLAFNTSCGTIPITVSIGAAGTVNGGENINELLQQADWALYEAKCRGRDQTKAYKTMVV